MALIIELLRDDLSGAVDLDKFATSVEERADNRIILETLKLKQRVINLQKISYKYTIRGIIDSNKVSTRKALVDLFETPRPRLVRMRWRNFPRIDQTAPTEPDGTIADFNQRYKDGVITSLSFSDKAEREGRLEFVIEFTEGTVKQ
jgi:hypothetical protein